MFRIVFYPSINADFHTHVAENHTHPRYPLTHINTHICELMLPADSPWCAFHTPPLLPLQGAQSDAVCREQPCLSAAWSQMAWCGWLWLRLLSPPDHHMMNHIPALSKNDTHTNTDTRTHTHRGRPTRSKHSSEQSQQRETTVLSPRRAWRLILTSQRSSQQRQGEQEKQKIHQGAKGRREKAELQPSAVRVSLLLTL